MRKDIHGLYVERLSVSSEDLLLSPEPVEEELIKKCYEICKILLHGKNKKFLHLCFPIVGTNGFMHLCTIYIEAPHRIGV